MQEPFEVRGDLPEWKMIYDRLKTLKIDEMVTYEDLYLVLGRVFQEDRSPLYRAVKELEHHDSRTLVNVRGQGYRVAHPSEHEGLAKGHVRKSHRQLTKARSRADSADRSGLDPETRKRLEALSVHLGAVHRMVVKLNRKTSEQDEALMKVRRQVQRDRRESQEDLAALSDRLDQVHSLLERHGIVPSEK